MKEGNTVLRPLLAALAALLLASCCPVDQTDERGWPKELVLGLVPALEADALVDNLDPLAEYLEAELGVPVRSFVPQDYTGLVEALGSGTLSQGVEHCVFSYEGCSDPQTPACAAGRRLDAKVERKKKRAHAVM